MRINRYLLLIFSGLIWVVVGIMLINLARIRLNESDGYSKVLYVALGLILAAIKFRIVFIPMVDKNLKRLYSYDKKVLFYKALPPATYLIIFCMFILGLTLTKLKLPSQYLAVVDIAIGFGLFFSGLRHFNKVVCYAE